MTKKLTFGDPWSAIFQYGRHNLIDEAFSKNQTSHRGLILYSCTCIDRCTAVQHGRICKSGSLFCICTWWVVVARPLRWGLVLSKLAPTCHPSSSIQNPTVWPADDWEWGSSSKYRFGIWHVWYADIKGILEKWEASWINIMENEKVVRILQSQEILIRINWWRALKEYRILPR